MNRHDNCVLCSKTLNSSGDPLFKDKELYLDLKDFFGIVRVMIFCLQTNHFETIMSIIEYETGSADGATSSSKSHHGISPEELHCYIGEFLLDRDITLSDSLDFWQIAHKSFSQELFIMYARKCYMMLEYLPRDYIYYYHVRILYNSAKNTAFLEFLRTEVLLPLSIKYRDYYTFHWCMASAYKGAKSRMLLWRAFKQRDDILIELALNGMCIEMFMSNADCLIHLIVFFGLCVLFLHFRPLWKLREYIWRRLDYDTWREMALFQKLGFEGILGC